MSSSVAWHGAAMKAFTTPAMKNLKAVNYRQKPTNTNYIFTVWELLKKRIKSSLEINSKEDT